MNSYKGKLRIIANFRQETGNAPIFLFVALNKNVDSRESGFSGTTKQEVSIVVLSQVGNELVTWISWIKKQHSS